MKIVTFIIVLLSLSACGSGTWVDTVGPSCKDGKFVKDAYAEMMKDIGKGTCMTSGKSFTGDIQCKGDDVQVKCK